MQHLTPASVSFLGQGAVAAASMSSADACMLSTGALFTKNVYVPLIRPKVGIVDVGLLRVASMPIIETATWL
ncbi:hypothetical protein IscW_ISCW012917 [Ixodes scapularis]|uniref:Uncharacterized protein n=1 Tax=Ixodes scapularis TaxID=6945 RepID=B7QCJ9_IXOSC|nr:hypothetical protein IscW_ISCW012917 [Ixodes scapularis]|eukprot:XP_002413263.1 hypothetical protein IscW_ISCW012917 [Ixodes scapularis]